MNQMPELPRLDENLMNRRLELPSGRVRLIIDTDAHNQIDDQFALAWALLSQDSFEILGILAEPYDTSLQLEHTIAAYDALRSDANAKPTGPASRYIAKARRMLANKINPRDIPSVTPDKGMELSYQEILKVDKLLGTGFSNLSFRGSDSFLTSFDEPVDSPAARFIIEQAMAQSPDDEPIYIAAIGCVTNIASAILMEPRIRERIVVTWTASYPTYWEYSNVPSFNLVLDPLSSQLLFACGVPHVYLPGYYIGELLIISQPEMERWVAPYGKIGAYLQELYTEKNLLRTMFGINMDDLFGRSWVVWDLINFAWLMNPDWVPSKIRTSPLLDDDLVYRPNPNPFPMREAYEIKRDEIYRDFFLKLAKHARKDDYTHYFD